MRGAVLAIALAAMPAAAQEVEKRTTVGTLHSAGYVVGGIMTAPATDAAAIRLSFTMEHEEDRSKPLYMCRLFVGPGDGDEEMIQINACERLD